MAFLDTWGNGTLIFMIIVYAIIGSFCLYKAITISMLEGAPCSKKHQYKLGYRRLIFYLLALPTLFRSIDMLIWRKQYFGTLGVTQSVWGKFTGSAPNYTFFSCYSLLFCTYIYFTEKAYRGKEKHRSDSYKWFLISNVAVYVAWIVLLIAFGLTTGEASNTVHTVEFFFATFLAIVSGTLFAIYGYKMNRRLTEMASVTLDSQNSSQSLAIANQIKRLTIIFTVALCAKSVLMFLLFFFEDANEVFKFLSRVLFQAVCEIVPTLFTMGTLWKPLKKTKSRDVLQASLLTDSEL